MRLLLDTHALVWSLVVPERLSGPARNAIESRANTVLASAVSGYEIELKRSRDPILAAVPWGLYAGALEAGFEWLSIEPAHAILAGRLPLHHRDPCDRLLAAQALSEDAVLVTADPWLTPYGVRTLW